MGGRYQVGLTLYDLATGEPLPMFGDYLGLELPSAAPVHYFNIGAAMEDEDEVVGP